MSLLLNLVLFAQVKSQLCHDRVGATKILTLPPLYTLYFIMHFGQYCICIVQEPELQWHPLSHTGDMQVTASHGIIVCELTEVTWALS